MERNFYEGLEEVQMNAKWINANDSAPNFIIEIMNLFQFIAVVIFIILVLGVIVNKLKNKKIKKSHKICLVISAITFICVSAMNLIFIA